MPRLLGLETELAIRFSSDGGPRPGNDVIYQALAGAVRELVQTQPGESHGVEEHRLFTESGASLCYEALPQAHDGGLVEVATPECDDPGQLVCHQRAIEALLLRAIPGACGRLAAQGYEGELALIKNCRDAEGHIYGAQENYEAEVARGAGLWLYRAALALAAPVLVVQAVLVWVSAILFAVTLIALLLLAAIAGLIVPRWRRAGFAERVLAHDNPVRDRAVGRAARLLDTVVAAPGLLFAALPLRLLAFRRQRRALLGFLVSRPVLTGAGTLQPDGSFGLSEKGPAIRRLVRIGTGSEDRPLFDTGNLMKDFFAPVRLRIRPYLGLFRARQRLQLGLSDANVAQAAEYLKAGLTALLLDMAEAGALDDAPRPADPIAALHALVADPTLKARVPIAGGGEMSALELQRAYLDRARAYVRASKAVSLGAHQLLKLWTEALDALERDPATLVGALDWVTKRYLIEACAPDEPRSVQKKIDLRYHELGGGYFARIERAGLARRVVREEEIEDAIRNPPASTPARLRGQLVRELASEPLPVRVSWDSIRVGGRLRGKVIQLRPRR